MTGPHPPHRPVGADETLPYPDLPADGAVPPLVGFPPPPPAPGPQPKRRLTGLLLGGGVVIALIAALTTAAIMYAARGHRITSGGAFSETSTKAAIQHYLDALEHRDIDTIARNTLCGIYDGVRDRQSDQALAKLSSDAFRKQYSRAAVTSIDKIVYWSPDQVQALFTTDVTLATGGPPRAQVQGVAQLLAQDGQILVCSSILRTAGSY